MADAPLSIIFDMAKIVLENTIGTLLSVFGLFGDLIASMLGVSAAGGTLGVILFFVVLGVVGYLMFKFFVGALKTIGLLVLGVIALLAFIVIGLGLI